MENKIWKKKPKVDLLNFQDEQISSLQKKFGTNKTLNLFCRKCGDHLKSFASKRYGICPMCDLG